MAKRETGWVRHAAFDEQLGRPCEVIELDTRGPEGSHSLADVRRLAAEVPRWTQTIVRIEDARPGWVRLSTTALDGVPLLEYLATAPVPAAMHALDQLLADLGAAVQSALPPRRLVEGVVTDGRVVLPLVDLLRTGTDAGLRPDLCAMLGVLATRTDVPDRIHGVLEAFDRDLFEDLDSLRAALTRATMPWYRRHRIAVSISLALVALVALTAAYVTWTREAPLDDVIKDDLDARVMQMHALVERATPLPRSQGPDLEGQWRDEDGVLTRIRPVGDSDTGRWAFESGTFDQDPNVPGYWRHHGVLTLRALEGRRFLTGSLAREPGGDDAWVDVELELVGDALRLRSSVFHDPGVGYTFGYFLGSLRRVP